MMCKDYMGKERKKILKKTNQIFFLHMSLKGRRVGMTHLKHNGIVLKLYDLWHHHVILPTSRKLLNPIHKKVT